MVGQAVDGVDVRPGLALAGGVDGHGERAERRGGPVETISPPRPRCELEQRRAEPECCLEAEGGVVVLADLLLDDRPVGSERLVTELTEQDGRADAAYDQNMLGVSPDYRVAVNRSLLDEVDGPMLRHRIQEMHGREIVLPRRRRTDRPDRDGLAWRWARFTAR